MSADEKSTDPNRLQGFSDAVFGFACTLLVVSLEAPKNYAQLMEDLGGFLAFGLAFAMLILVWSAHHRLFRRFPLDDAWTVFLNSCLLFTVLLFVYPLKFLAVGVVSSMTGLGGPVDQGINSTRQIQNLYVIYGAAFAAIFGLIAALYLRAYQWAQCAGLQSNARFASENARHYLSYSAVACLSVLCSALSIGISDGVPGLIYFLLGPSAWLNGVAARRRSRRQGLPD